MTGSDVDNCQGEAWQSAHQLGWDAQLIRVWTDGSAGKDRQSLGRCIVLSIYPS